MSEDIEPREHISWLIKQAHHYTRRAVDDATRVHGVTQTQGSVLIRLARTPGLSAAELARQMSITPQASQQTLITLQELGLIERTPDPENARIMRAELTEQGHKVARLCRSEALAIENLLLAGFTEQERATFTDLLLRYMHDSPSGE